MNSARMAGLLSLAGVWLLSIYCGRSSRNSSLLPGPTEVQGWSQTATPRSYGPSDLWQYVDGDAERYLKAGFERVYTSDYLHSSGLEAKADVFVMRDERAVRELWSQEPAEGSQPLTLGDEARAYPGTIVFRKGRYLVRVVSYGATSQQEPLQTLAQAVARRLDGGATQ